MRLNHVRPCLSLPMNRPTLPPGANYDKLVQLNYPQLDILGYLATSVRHLYVLYRRMGMSQIVAKYYTILDYTGRTPDELYDTFYGFDSD